MRPPGPPRPRAPSSTTSLSRARRRSSRRRDEALRWRPAPSAVYIRYRAYGSPTPAASAALAEREPRWAGSPARPAAAEGSVANLDVEPPYDALRGGLLELGGPLDRHPSDAGVLQREPAQDARRRGPPPPPRRARRRAAGRCPAGTGAAAAGRVAGDRERKHSRGARRRRVDRRVDELPGVLEPESPAALAQMPLDDGEAPADRLQRLDGEPALVRPLADGDAMPRGERRVEVARVVDAEIAEPWADPRLVDDAVAAVPLRGARRGARAPTRTRSGSALAQGSPTRTPTWPRSTRPKRPARPAICASSHGSRSRRCLAVELRRLGEEQRLAREVDTVAEDVGRDADLGAAGEEAVDLLAPRGERHRAVEHRHPAGLQAVDLTGEREHRLAAEGDDERCPGSARGAAARRRTRAAACARGRGSRPAGNARSHERAARRARRAARMCRYSPASRSSVHAAPRSSSSAHCTSSRTSTSPVEGAISTVRADDRRVAR